MLNKKEKQELKELLQKQWDSEKMVEHCMKSSVYIKLNDKFVQVGGNEPTISKTLWFDDEKPIPKKSKEIFIEYNMFYNAPSFYKIKDRYHNNLVIAPMYSKDETDFNLAGLMYNAQGEFIEVSEEDLEEINKVVEVLREKYEKRLNNYWNRYNQHVHFSGYWVNR